MLGTWLHPIHNMKTPTHTLRWNFNTCVVSNVCCFQENWKIIRHTSNKRKSPSIFMFYTTLHLHYTATHLVKEQKNEKNPPISCLSSNVLKFKSRVPHNKQVQERHRRLLALPGYFDKKMVFPLVHYRHTALSSGYMTWLLYQATNSLTISCKALIWPTTRTEILL